jgi:hypothetical protein
VQTGCGSSTAGVGSAVSVYGDGNVIANGVCEYGAAYPHGAIQSLARGDTLTESWGCNDRLEATLVNGGTAFVMNLYYCPGKGTMCATINRNVVKATLAIPGVDQVYGYGEGVHRRRLYPTGGRAGRRACCSRGSTGMRRM